MPRKRSKATGYILDRNVREDCDEQRASLGKQQPHRTQCPLMSPDGSVKEPIDRPGFLHCLRNPDVPSQPPSNRSPSNEQGQFDGLEGCAVVDFYSCVRDLTLLSLENEENLSVRFIEHFFNTGDAVSACLLEEWRDFTQTYESMNRDEAFAFMAIVYGAMSISLLYCRSLGVLAPGDIPAEDRLILRSLELCSMCLDCSNLNEAGRYKVEAAAVRLTAELYIKFNLQKAYASVGQVLALAESLGYTNLSEAPVCEAGRRQETWLYLRHCQYYVSFYYGKIQTVLPKRNQSWTVHYRMTKDPIHCPVKPCPRSTLALIHKIEEAATDIGLRIFQETNITAEALQEFDHQLEEIYKQQLKHVMGHLVETFQTRQMVMIVYHAARLVSHRWALLGENIHRSDAISTFSRQKCLQSAMEILTIQRILQNHRKSHNPSMLSPLILCDFLLAQTVLRLELSYLIRVHNPAPAFEQHRQVYYSSTTISEILRDSLQAWGELDMISVPWNANLVCQETKSTLSDHDHMVINEVHHE
ncbi:hypothetical protein TruAng_011349 [Truncatella angustata]|nr:hypothetical protein TruAng_011349 [Truncatella angustata]